MIIVFFQDELLAIEAVCKKKEEKEEIEKQADLFDKNTTIKIENESNERDVDSQLEDNKSIHDSVMIQDDQSFNTNTHVGEKPDMLHNTNNVDDTTKGTIQ